jgi:hypothetical protein
MEVWNNILSKYNQFSKESKQLIIESEWLNDKFNRSCDVTDLNWAGYTEKEKRIRRIKDSKLYKKTEGYDRGIFELEEAVIDLYESINCSVCKLNNSFSDILSTRLLAHLLLLKKTINCYRDVRHFFYQRFLASF